MIDTRDLAGELFSFAQTSTTPKNLYFIEGNELKFRFHQYQKQAMRSRRRFILLLGGTQSGKTSFGSIWLHREIVIRGAGDYLAVAPTYPLMKKKMLPEFEKFFDETLGLGTYNKTDKIFTVSRDGEMSLFGEHQKNKTLIHFGHAQDPDSLESATAKAMWLDECGQKKFKLGSFEALMRRQSLFMGRVLMTTTPYYLGWLKEKFYDLLGTQEAVEQSVEVISFPSIANPSFPRAEYERAKRDLPRWKFDMFYNARFTRPAGLIYDCFDKEAHTMESFPIPDMWQRFAGVDFGGVNTAAVFICKAPMDDRLYVYREYHAGNKTAKQHTTEMLSGWRGVPVAYGGAPSESNWRSEFGAAGLPINKPLVKDVEVGINRVYSAIKHGKIVIFNNAVELLDELASYSRETDEMGKPTEKIENKSDYHLLDALRYIMTYLNQENANNDWGRQLNEALRQRR